MPINIWYINKSNLGDSSMPLFGLKLLKYSIIEEDIKNKEKFNFLLKTLKESLIFSNPLTN